MPLSVEGLQSLLRDDEGTNDAGISDQVKTTARNQTESFMAKDRPRLQSLRNELLDRPIPATLYRCPISPAQTTLVLWDSLPKKIQEQILENHPQCYNVTLMDDANTDFHGRAVEIPKSYLESVVPAPGEARQLQQQQRGGASNTKPRLQGNLRDKLAEYTRGLTGQARVFRPGGVVDGSEKQEADEDPYRTPEIMARHEQVLGRWPKGGDIEDDELGRMWNEGLLLTAPLGVDFKVGLSYQKDCTNFTSHLSNEEKQEELDHDRQKSWNAGKDTERPSATARSTGLFQTNAAYFVENEIDSLFGSSSGSESIYDEDDADADAHERLPESDGTIKLDFSAVDESQPNDLNGEDEKEEEEVDIDLLLAELTVSTSEGKQKPMLNDPLSIAQRQARDQNDATRKAWASTKLLAIDDFQEFIPNPALSYPFTLDGFQQQAIARLERSENVFVAAHTSAGKTVVAEYAVALALQRATRCVYTSPIKALSNQKFRDFALKFGAKNVGLITGDLQVNAGDSTCLIMTTEILRSMLYRGADLIRDIEYVIFDEVHYINDTERGVVWEEVIIMLPAHVTMVFLSATTPNTLEFSDWIGRTKRKPVYVVRTDYRPVPLSFNLWAGNDLHKILEGKSGFIEKGYRDAANALLPASAKDPKKKGDPRAKSRKPVSGSKTMVWQVQGDKSNWVSLVNYLDRYVLTPTVVFSFSKKKCEEIAGMLQSVDLNTAKERSAAQGFTLQAISRLSPNDSKLPQVQMIFEMVQRGIGVHHGGLLPILKECVEILFSRNLIKILLATETFAMGVNMPAKAVVFNSLRKHDGNQFRNLEPGEMTQMAGRAGRRGLDEVGIVIICCFGEEPPPESILRQVLTGSSTRLRSQFRLTYNMILNLLRVEDMSVENMIKRSFSEFATQRALAANNLPRLLAKGRRKLIKLGEEIAMETSVLAGAEDLEQYFAQSKMLLSTNRDLFEFIKGTDSMAFKDLFVPGRLLLVTAARSHGVVREPAVVLRLPDEQERPRGAKGTARTTLICMVLLPSGHPGAVTNENEPSKKSGSIGYIGKCEGRHYSIQEIVLGQIFLVLDRKIRIDAGEILKDENDARTGAAFFGRARDADIFSGMKAVGKKKQTDAFLAAPALKQQSQEELAIGALQEAERNELTGRGFAAVDLKAFVQRGMDILHFREACHQIDSFALQARSLKSHRHPALEVHYVKLENKDCLQEKVFTLQHLLSNEALSLFPDFLQRKAVLKRLGYLNENETVFFKGRVACEVNTCEELIATEMVFEGVLDDLKPEEIAAVLSALVFQEKNDSELDSELPDSLVDCCEKMKTIATNLGQVQKDAGLQVDPGEYKDNSLKFGLVHVVYEWALGVTFKNICQLTNVQEGSIVRCITRLDELCREIRNCARVVGNPSLYRKLEAASEAIKRDIVFASSLYVS